MVKRTDLAIEHFENISPPPENELQKSEYKKNGLKITDIKILNDKTAKEYKKPKGRYVTVTIPNLLTHPEAENDIENTLSDILSDFLPNEGTVLVVGLGNQEITPDALGPKVAKKIFATRHIPKEISETAGLSPLRPVCSLPVGVLGQTGIESEETVQKIADTVSASAVIVIDALASQSISRLFTTVQITDTGISPGSGVQNKRKTISKGTLSGIPVIAVGIPTVTDASSLLEKENENVKNMVVTPKDVDKLIEKSAAVISSAINLSLFPHLSKTDIKYLV